MRARLCAGDGVRACFYVVCSILSYHSEKRRRVSGNAESNAARGSEAAVALQGTRPRAVVAEIRKERCIAASAGKPALPKASS